MDPLKKSLDDLVSEFESVKSKLMTMESLIFIAKAMISLTPEKENNQVKEFLTYQELSDIIGIPVGSLQVMVCKKEIPYYKRNGVKFNRNEIMNWMNESKIDAINKLK
jgi:hypothetical protein